jgi:hypothetical protein
MHTTANFLPFASKVVLALSIYSFILSFLPSVLGIHSTS